jgi:AcrR family transcriptional regulator
MTKSRGRPRAYDPATALQSALEAFWKDGFWGTSLDDLSVAMGLSRPSIYAGFGDKRSLYHQTIELYCAVEYVSAKWALSEERPLGMGLRLLARRAIANYVAGAFGPRGCFMAGTVVTDAQSDPVARRALEASIRDLQAMLTERFRRAGESREVELAGPPEVLAHMACDVLYGLALRARAGEPREDLERSADAAMALLGGRRPAAMDAGAS